MVKLVSSVSPVQPVDGVEGLATCFYEPWVDGDQLDPEHGLKSSGSQSLLLTAEFGKVGFLMALMTCKPEVHLPAAVVRERAGEGAVSGDAFLPQPLATRELLRPARRLPLKYMSQPRSQESAHHGYHARCYDFHFLREP